MPQLNIGLSELFCAGYRQCRMGDRMAEAHDVELGLWSTVCWADQSKETAAAQVRSESIYCSNEKALSAVK